MLRADDSVCRMNAQPGRGSAAARPAATPEAVSRDEAFETSRLVVELLHAARASRRSPGTEEPLAGGDASAVHAASPSADPISDHVIRASIYLYQHGERTVGQLAAGLGISRGWASRVAEELVARGHAAREDDLGDRRVVRLRLTEQALAEIERAYRWRGDVVAAALAEHAPRERDAIRRFLRRVAEGLEAETAGGARRDA